MGEEKNKKNRNGMSSEYTNNHYVPDWYQRRFIPPGQRDQELYYLNLQPETVFDAKGRQHTMARTQFFGHFFSFQPGKE